MCQWKQILTRQAIEQEDQKDDEKVWLAEDQDGVAEGSDYKGSHGNHEGVGDDPRNPVMKIQQEL